MEKLAKNFKIAIPRAMTKLSSGQFLGHGDFWSNNAMFGTEDCRIFDWQFFNGITPMFDFICMAFVNCSPEQSEEWLDLLIQTYYNTLEESCKSVNVQVPFSLEDFDQDVKCKGFSMLIAVFLAFYDPVGREPNMSKRLTWIVRKALKNDPKMFE
jgi:hypothetical protein